MIAFWIQIILLLLLLLLPSECVPATGKVELLGQAEALYFAPGDISKSRLPLKKDAEIQRLLIPTKGVTGCDVEQMSVPSFQPSGEKFVLLLEAGQCSFYKKAITAQRAGAAGVLIANTVRSIYGGRGHARVSDVNCAYGRGWIPAAKVLTPPYAAAMRDLMPVECTGDQQCASGRCLLTGVSDPPSGNMQVCCAWDFWIQMSLEKSDLALANVTSSKGLSAVNIPMGFLRLKDTDRLLRQPALPDGTLDVKLYAREASGDWSSLIAWLLAVLTVTYSSIYAANEDSSLLSHTHTLGSFSTVPDGEEASLGSLPSKRPLYRRRQQGAGASAPAAVRTPTRTRANSRDNMESGGLSVAYANEHDYGGTGSFSASASNRRGTAAEFGEERRSVNAEDVSSVVSEYYWRARGKFVHSAVHDATASAPDDDLQITPLMATGCILAISGFLVLMSHVNAYWAISVTFMAGSALGIYMLFLQESVPRALLRLHSALWQGQGQGHSRGPAEDSRQDDVSIDEFQAVDSESSPLVGPIGSDKEQHALSSSHIFVSQLRRLCSVTNAAGLVCLLCSAALPVTWLVCRHTPFGWVLQDILCVVLVTFFLTHFRIPNLSALCALLTCAFCYDVFFVFLQPILFGGPSIMAKVALQHAAVGAPEHPEQAVGDGTYCDKYPSETLCQPDLLPIMITVPALGAWESSVNGGHLLGLGDLVLPGTLLVWVARCDMRLHGSLSATHGSFFPTVVAGYAIGLCLATVVAQAFKTGQPALMYIVPCTLVPVLFRAWRSGDFWDLWAGLPHKRTVAQPLPLDADKAEEFNRRKDKEQLAKAIAAWPPDTAHEESVVRLSADETPIVPIPWRSAEKVASLSFPGDAFERIRHSQAPAPIASIQDSKRSRE